MNSLRLLLILGLPLLSGCLTMEPVAFASGHPANVESAEPHEGESTSRLLEYTIPQTRHPLGEESTQLIAPPILGRQFTCPMHPEIVQNHEGRCPKCDMRLVPQATGASTAIPGETL